MEYFVLQLYGTVCHFNWYRFYEYMLGKYYVKLGAVFLKTFLLQQSNGRLFLTVGVIF